MIIFLLYIPPLLLRWFYFELQVLSGLKTQQWHVSWTPRQALLKLPLAEVSQSKNSSQVKGKWGWAVGTVFSIAYTLTEIID